MYDALTLVHVCMQHSVAYNEGSNACDDTAGGKLNLTAVGKLRYPANICITLLQRRYVQRRPNLFDVGPPLYKCYTNVLCLLYF